MEKEKKVDMHYKRTSLQPALHQILRFYSVLVVYTVIQSYFLNRYGERIVLFLTVQLPFFSRRTIYIGLTWLGSQAALVGPWLLTASQRQNQKQNSSIRYPSSTKLFCFVVFNHVLLSSLTGYMCLNILLVSQSFAFDVDSWNFILLTQQFLLLTLIADFSFWMIHILFHTPILYNHFHFLHHQIIYPEPLTTFYVHPMEHLCVNLFPIFLGPFCVRPHPFLLVFWFTNSTLSAVHNHTHSHSNFFISSIFHLSHHRYFNINFGISGLFDFIYLFFLYLVEWKQSKS